MTGRAPTVAAARPDGEAGPRRLGGGVLGALLTFYPPAVLAGVLVHVMRGVRPGLVGGAWLWLATALLVSPSVAAALRSGLGENTVRGALEAVAVLACAYGGSVLGRAGHSPRSLAPGAAAALVLAAAVSVAQLLVWGGRVAGWSSHPNLWAGAAVLPAALAAAGAVTPRTALAAVSAAAVVAVAAGSRAALVGVALVGLYALVGARRPERRLVATAVTCLLALVALALLQPRLWRGAAEVVRALPVWAAGGEVLGVPQALGVTVEPRPGGGYLVTRDAGGQWWARYQWPALLLPDKEYALSWELRSLSDGAAPGVLGVVRGDDTVELRFGPGGWNAAAGGRIELLAWDVSPSEVGWVRVSLALRSSAAEPLRLWVGPAPDLSGGAGPAVLEVSDARGVVGGLSDLAAAGRTEPFSAATEAVLARLSAYRAAWSAFLERPLLGRWDEPFADHYRAYPPDQGTFVPEHAHSEPLQALYERGLLGSAGLVLLLGWAVSQLARAGWTGLARSCLAAMVVMSLVDTYLWGAGMLTFQLVVGGVASARPNGSIR